MIAVEYRRTMARAVPVADVEETARRLSSRARVIEMARRWQDEQARKTAAIDAALERAARRHRRTRPYEPGNNGTPAQQIIARVAAWHGVAAAEITGKSREAAVVAARFDAIAAIFLNCRIDGRRYSLPELGRLFSKDHTSILHALRKRGLKE